jgi:uncharacterized membrane protein YfcA
MVVFVNTFTALLGHSIIGEIDLTLVLFLTSGSMLGAWTGANVLTKVTIGKWEKHVKYVFVLIILTSGILLIL